MKVRSTASSELKREAVRRVSAGERAIDVARDLKCNRQRIYEWQEVVRKHGLEALRGPGRPRKDALTVPVRSALLNDGAAARRRIAELERKVGEQQVTIDFFRQALRHVKARQRAVDAPAARGSTKSSGR